MDLKTRLLGLRTALKISANALERLELNQDDWKVGCKCSSADKAVFVIELLKNNLSVLQLEELSVLLLDDNIVEVSLPARNAAEPVQNLVVKVCDKASVCDSPQDDKECRGTETPSASSASTDDEEEKVFKSIDDMISCFQKDL